MKTILLLRHAKSGWSDPALDDPFTVDVAAVEASHTGRFLAPLLQREAEPA